MKLIPSASYKSSDQTAKDRVDHWRAHMAPFLEIQLPPPIRASEFAVETTKSMLGGTLFTSGHLQAQSMVRHARQARVDQIDHYSIQMSPAANFNVDANGACARLQDRQLVVLDLSRPLRIEYCSGLNVTVILPRATVNKFLSRNVDLHGMVLRGAASDLLASYLLTLSAHLPRMNQIEAAGAKDALLHLLAASLSPGMKLLPDSRECIEGVLKTRIANYIEANLKVNLGIDDLCKRFKISRSTLYRIFEPTGVKNYIAERRLLQIYQLLKNMDSRRYIGCIAGDYGFENPAYFSRIFKARFGCTPREVEIRADDQKVSHIRMPGSGEFAKWVHAVGD